MNDDDPIAAPSGRRLLSIAPTRMLESDVRRELSPVTISMTVIALFVGLAALNYGRVLLLPLATAILLNVVLRPLSRRMARIGVPYPVSALFLVGVIAGAIGLAGYGLNEPALQWLKEAPSSLRVLKDRLGELREPMENMQAATREMAKLGDLAGGNGDAVVVTRKELPSLMLNAIQEATTGLFMTLVILFFVLGWGHRLYRHVLSALPHFTQQRRAVRIAHEVEVSVAAYLTTITLINFCLGVIVAAAMYALDVPNPILWGVMSAVLNYIPFLGPAVMAVVLTFVSVLTHPTLAAALIVPAVFILITSIEGYFVTPAAVGRHLTLNPLLIVVSLIFWFWMWGIIGGLLSVPLLVCLKVSLEHTLGPEVARIMG